jgi:hypothetical protein
VLIKSKDKLFQVVQANVPDSNKNEWSALVPVDFKEVENPVNRWNGGRITLDLWHRITKFFEWSMKETKSEAMVHLFYHWKDERWDALVLPQKGYNGMRVDMLPDHPNYIPTFQKLGKGGEDVIVMGSVHHHCDAPAFQSSGDRGTGAGGGEVTTTGLHATIGKVGSNQYDLHVRSTFRKTITDVVLSDWFDIGPQYDGLPSYLLSQIVHHFLTKPAPEGTVFPEWWKDNVINVPSPPVLTTKVFDSGWSPPGPWDKNPQPQLPPAKPKHRQQYLKDELREFAQESDMTPVEMAGWIKDLNEQTAIPDLVEILNDYNATLEDAADALLEVAEDNNFNFPVDDDLTLNDIGD